MPNSSGTRVTSSPAPTLGGSGSKTPSPSRTVTDTPGSVTGDCEESDEFSITSSQAPVLEECYQPAGGASNFDGQAYSVTGTLASEQVMVAQIDIDGDVSFLAPKIVVHTATSYPRNRPHTLQQYHGHCHCQCFLHLGFQSENARGMPRRSTCVGQKEIKSLIMFERNASRVFYMYSTKYRLADVVSLLLSRWGALTLDIICFTTSFVLLSWQLEWCRCFLHAVTSISHLSIHFPREYLPVFGRPRPYGS